MNLRFVVLFSISVPIASTYIGLQSLDCVSKCWENSKLVSPCMTEAKCLCDDARFRSAFLQCLYSQCQTAQYGLALHHAISTCSKYGSNVVPMLPTLIRHRNRRTPDVETVPNHPSSSASHLPIRSAIRSIPVQTASILFMRKPRATGTPSLVTHSMPVQTASNLFMRKPCATGTPGSAAHLIPVQTASIPFMRRPRATGTSLDHSLDFSTNR